jgi:DNA-binding NarL/FixJ family response regulator
MDDEGNKNSILIIEDHHLFADGMVGKLLTIDSTLKITICGTAQTALSEFHRANNWFRIFLDIDLPGSRGLSLARQFTELGVARKCAVMTATDNPLWRTEVKSMGMLGYIAKAAPREKLTFAFEEILQGRPAFPKTLLSEPPAMQSIPQAAVRLTRRQQDMLCLLHRGYTSKSIAVQLGLSTGTVDNHVFGLLKALSARSRAQAVAKGVELGYIQFSDISRYNPQLERA